MYDEVSTTEADYKSDIQPQNLMNNNNNNNNNNNSNNSGHSLGLNMKFDSFASNPSDNGHSTELRNNNSSSSMSAMTPLRLMPDLGAAGSQPSIKLYGYDHPLPLTPSAVLYHASREDALKKVQNTTEIDDPEITATKHFINKVGNVLPYMFLLSMCITIALYVCGFIEPLYKQYFIWCIITCITLCSFLGMWGMYQYGVINDQIDRLYDENVRYENELVKLETTRENLSAHVTELQESVHTLKNDSLAIEESNAEFESLKNDLDSIATEDEEIIDVIKNVHQIFHDMQFIILETDRAFLLESFYACAFKDGDSRMNEKEYGFFLARLSKKQRERFSNFSFRERATMDEDGSEGIDKSDFLDLIEDVLSTVDDVIERIA